MMSISLLKVSWQLCLVVMLLLWTSSDACYIRNCPKGGKRSMEPTTRPCMSCGAEGAGQCVGPSVCCGPFGCLMGGAAAECQRENESGTPCAPRGAPCGANDMGVCATDNLCCTDDACSFNDLCHQEVNENSELSDERGETRRELAALIRRLLNKRQYD